MKVIQPLIDLQDVDGRIRELEREARDIPQRKAQETARLAGAEAALQVAKNRLAAQQKMIKECEDEAEQLRAKVQEMKIAQASIESNREMQQSIIRIESFENEISGAENRATAMMDGLVPLEKDVEAAQAKVDAEKGGVDGYVAELEARLGEVKVELDELAKERAAKVALVQPRHLLYYERLRTKRWPVVVTLNEDGVCDGCHLVQPPSVAQMVQHNKDLVACTMCGRVLYRDV